MKITYENLDKFDGWSRCPGAIEDIIAHYNLKRICEIGAGCNPTLSIDVVQKRNLDYTILDVSETELAKAPEGYNRWCADVASPDFETKTGFDLIFSRMLVEHVVNAQQMHRNIFKMLAPGGFAVHYFPTFYTFPFVVNRIFAESISSALMDWFSPRSRYHHDKFKAYYNWCLGPVPANLDRFQSTGFAIVEYRGYFGHRYYKKIPLLRELHQLETTLLLKFPIPWLTSYAAILLNRPTTSSS